MLRGERVVLRPLAPADVEPLWRATLAPLTWARTSAQPLHPGTLSAHMARYAERDTSATSEFAVDVGDALVGRALLFSVDEIPSPHTWTAPPGRNSIVFHVELGGTMRTRARIIAVALSLPLGAATVIGPLGGAAAADPPTTTESTLAVVPGSVLDYPITAVVNDRGVETVTFTERYTDTGDFPGSSVTTWTCVIPADRQDFRCTGEGTFTGTFDGVTGPSKSTLRARCSESGTAPVIVSCTGRFRLDGRAALDGLKAHGTFSSSGVFGATVRGSSQARVHFHHR